MESERLVSLTTESNQFERGRLLFSKFLFVLIDGELVVIRVPNILLHQKEDLVENANAKASEGGEPQQSVLSTAQIQMMKAEEATDEGEEVGGR